MEFDESQAELGDDGAELYHGRLRRRHDEVQEFFDDNGGDWPIVFDSDGSISAAFAVNQVPETWIVDPDGVVQWRGIGEMTAAGLNAGRRRAAAGRPADDHGAGVDSTAGVKGVVGWLALLFVAVALLVVGATSNNGASTPAERAQALEQRLACPVCDGESVFESRNQSAVNLRNEIESLVNAGQLSDEQIIARIESRLNERREPAAAAEVDRDRRPGVGACRSRRSCAARPGLVVAFRRWRLASRRRLGADRRRP